MQVINYNKVSELYKLVISNEKLYYEISHIDKRNYKTIKEKYIKKFKINNDEFEILIVNIFDTLELLNDSDDEEVFIDQKKSKTVNKSSDKNKENYMNNRYLHNELQFYMEM